MRTIIKAHQTKKATKTAHHTRAAKTRRMRKENTMNALYIEGRRSGYAPDDCGKTLTVGELIEILSDFDEDLPVYLRNDNGYTYGNITERTIIPSEDLEEGDDE